MDKELWKKIAEDYRMAKKYLWCPSDAGEWHRDEEQGYYYMWNAYHAATASDEKDSLLYARILMMMSHESYHMHDYDRFYKLIAPAKKAYEDAIFSGQLVSEKELEAINRTYASLQYNLKKTDDTAEQIDEAYSYVNGLNAVEGFGFHDSKPVYFEQRDDCALLKLDYEGICVTLEFTGIVDIQVNEDPLANWVQDFYCYPLFDNPKYYYFDIGYYQITCEHIRAREVTFE